MFGTDAAPADVVPLTEKDLGQLAGVPATLVNRTLRGAQENAFLRVSPEAIEIYDAAAYRGPGAVSGAQAKRTGSDSRPRSTIESR